MANVIITIPYDETKMFEDALNSVNRDAKYLTQQTTMVMILTAFKYGMEKEK